MFDFVGKKKYTFAFSLLIIAIGVVFYFINGGFNFDVQFQGGTVISLEMKDSNFDTNKIAEDVHELVGKNANVQKTVSKDPSTNEDIYHLSISIASEDTLSEDEIDKVVDEIRANYNVEEGTQSEQVRTIQPSIGKDILNSGLLALLISSVLILLYIGYRFRVMSGISAGITAIIALVHDCLIILSVYAIFQIPMNDTFIAALLTIIGYSINDTVVIYDRIRENTSLLRKSSYEEVVNRSINQSLSRTVNTSILVWLCLGSLLGFSLFYNLSSITQFALPLFIGTVAGTYSSICIASPLWVTFKNLSKKMK